MNLTVEILEELKPVAEEIDKAQVEEFCQRIFAAKRIYLAGRGRSGLIARMFAMRLMHMELEAYVVDEVVTPAIGKDDLLIICSGSGETESLKTMADRAKAAGASLMLITANEESYIADRADAKIVIHGYTPKNEKNVHSSIQPLGAQFEQLQMLLLDGIVVMLKQQIGVSEEKMMARHANLE